MGLFLGFLSCSIGLYFCFRKIWNASQSCMLSLHRGHANLLCCSNFTVCGANVSTYCENVYTTKCNLQVQCDPYQITNGIFHRTRTKNFATHMETQKTLNSQSSLEKEEWSFRNQPSWLLIIVQSYSHQDSMVLAQKQRYRPTEQDRKPRNKPMHLWAPYFWQKRQEYTMGQRQPLQ